METFAAPVLLLAQMIIGASELLPNAARQNESYTGIGRLRTGVTCTATFLDTAPADPANAPAYVLSAGHCIGQDANEVIVSREYAAGRVTFHYFFDTQPGQVSFATRRVAWASMKGADLSVIELDASFARVREANVRPVRLARSRPAANEVVLNVGAPVTAIPPEEAFLRKSSCFLGPQADLAEYIWRFWDSYSNDCSDVRGGSSGSPMLLQRTGEIAAVINTTTLGAPGSTGNFICYSGVPCEITPGGVAVRANTNYAIPATGLDRCFDAAGRFDLGLLGCTLDNGRQLRLSPPRRAMQPWREDPGGNRVPASWNVTLSGNLPYYRHKTVAAGQGDCRVGEGYGSVLSLQGAPAVNDPLPPRDGIYFLCVIAGPTPAPDPSWQRPEFATAVWTRIDSEAPTIAMPFLFSDLGDQWSFAPVFVVPELSDYYYKLEPASGPGCLDRGDYLPYRRVPIRIPKQPGSDRFCLYGNDEAGNSAPAVEFRLDGPRIFPSGTVNAASFRPGPIAPGGLLSIFGVNFNQLAEPGAALTDSTGRRWPLGLLAVLPLQMNLTVPEGVAPGAATVSLGAGGGEVSVPVMVQNLSPGLFSANASGVGVALSYAQRSRPGAQPSTEPFFLCRPQEACGFNPVNIPAEGEQMVLAFYSTGLRAARNAAVVQLDIGGLLLDASSVEPMAGATEVEEVRVQLPAGFRLRGYLPVSLRVNGRASNTLALRFR